MVEQAGAQAVVDVVVVVGDLVGEIGDLRFERRPPLLEEALADLAQLARVRHRAVLEDAFASFERQIEAVESGVALLEDDRRRAGSAGCARSRRTASCTR